MNKFLAVTSLFCVFSISSIAIYASIRPVLHEEKPLKTTDKQGFENKKTITEKPTSLTVKDTLPTKDLIITKDSEALKEPALFAYQLQSNFGSQKFKGSKEFAVIVDSIDHILNHNKKLSLYVTGHTDSIGKAIDNEWIGMQRAKSVARYLKYKGISSAQMVVASKGETEPIAGNTETKKNRRIELIIK